MEPCFWEGTMSVTTVILLVVIVMIVTFVLSFFLSLLESCWLKVDTAEVVKYEGAYGASNRTALMKKLLKEQPIIVSFILLLIYCVLYAGVLMIGRLEVGIGETWLQVILILYPFLMFYLGEIVPKIIGIKHAFWWSRQSTYLLYGLMILMHPVIWLIRWTTKALGGYEEKLDEGDVIAAIKLAREHQALGGEEAAIIERYLKINNLTARGLMVPLEECSQIRKITSRGDLLHAVRKDRPIIATDATKPKIIIGFISPEDLLAFVLGNTQDPLDLGQIIGATVEIPEYMLIGEAYTLLRKNPVGRVIDESGKTLGFITLYDIAVKFLKARDGLE